MILYTLLTTHTGVDMTNVILTASIVYYIGYNVVAGFVSTDEYNYMGIAALALIDLYFSNQILQSGVPKYSVAQRPKTHKVPKQTGKRVRINPYPTAVHRYPNNPMTGQYGQPQLRPQLQPRPQLRPQYDQPQYPQYAQPQPQYGQPQLQPQYPQYGQQPQLPMIDNRELAAELESNDSEESIESITVSDTISCSSEEY